MWAIMMEIMIPLDLRAMSISVAMVSKVVHQRKTLVEGLILSGAGAPW